MRALLLAAALTLTLPAHSGAAMRVTSSVLDTTLTRHARLGYRVWLPAGYDQGDARWPLVLFLHGSGERGTDLEAVERNGPPRIARERDLPLIVVAPQLPAGELWSADALLALLDRVEGELRVDTTRVYLSGLSMGAFGAWDLAVAAPARFAALAVVSGGGNPVEICRLKDTPVWIAHGAKDDIIPVAWGEGMAHRLERCGGHPKLSVDPAAGHDAWTKFYADPALWDWMLAQKTAVRP
jgi:predicted peptidase